MGRVECEKASVLSTMPRQYRASTRIACVQVPVNYFIPPTPRPLFLIYIFVTVDGASVGGNQGA